MNSILALRNEIINDPKAIGYTNMTDAQILTSINNANITTTINPPIQSVFNTFLVRNVWVNIELLSRDNKTGVAAHDNALQAAISFVRMVASSPTGVVMMTDPATNATVTASLTALVTNGTIAQADANAVLALGTQTINRLQQIGWTTLATLNDIVAARGH
jgi:hypothetical protein